jgi:hypothetical protein
MCVCMCVYVCVCVCMCVPVCMNSILIKLQVLMVCYFFLHVIPNKDKYVDIDKLHRVTKEKPTAEQQLNKTVVS